MSTHKHIDRICLAVVIGSLLLTVLLMNGKTLGIQPLAGEEMDGPFTVDDLDGEWDPSRATQIHLTGGGGTVKGNGAYIADGNVHIVYAGSYVLSGELTDGSVVINADGDDQIRLLLDGVSLHCEDHAAIRVEQAGKVFLTLAEGTENRISGGETYADSAIRSGVDGAIYSRDDLTINGTGSLSVTAAYRHGIVCNDTLVITGGIIDISASQDGIHANDGVYVANAAITVSAGDDGITVSNDESTDELYVASGAITVTDCYEGLEATVVTIDGGTIDITPTDDGINAQKRIEINGGDIRIVNPDGRDADGLDSNGDITINGGTILISVSANGGSCAIDYGRENNGVCQINGGTVIACGGSQMLEEIDASSQQAFAMRTTSGQEGAQLTLRAEDGTELVSEQIPCSFTALVLSVPGLEQGDTCTLIIDDDAEEITMDCASISSGGGGMFGGMGGHGMFGGLQNGQNMDGDLPERPEGAGVPNQDDFPGQESDEAFKPEKFGQKGHMPFNGMPDLQGRPDRELPPGMEDPDGFPMEMQHGMRGEQQTEMSRDASGTLNGTTLALIGLSALALLAGLLVAVKFKD